jgi:uncharacterized protein (TIGR02001 family)
MSLAWKLQKGLRFPPNPMEFRFMKKTLVCLSVLSMFAAAAAQAQEAPTVTGNVTLTSKYKYRGQDQSDNQENLAPAIQGGFDVSYKGFYVGNWNSSVDFEDPAHNSSNIEMDLYGGYKGDLGNGLGFDVGVLRYQYPRGAVYNTTELYGAISWTFLTAKLSYTAGDRYFGFDEGRGTIYTDLSANYEVVKGVTLNGHVGYTALPSDLKNLYGLPSFIDYKVGATYDFGGGLSAAAAYVGANKDGMGEWGDTNKGRFIVSVTKAM